MNSLLYWVYYGITLLLAIGAFWSLFRKTPTANASLSRIPYEQMLSAFILIPLLLRLLGIK
ncbi:MAG: hypothetical protein N2450_02400 [bacterium]|nr:hypothetical protein [bacterium]